MRIFCKIEVVTTCYTSLKQGLKLSLRRLNDESLVWVTNDKSGGGILVPCSKLDLVDIRRKATYADKMKESQAKRCMQSGRSFSGTNRL